MNIFTDHPPSGGIGKKRMKSYVLRTSVPDLIGTIENIRKRSPRNFSKYIDCGRPVKIRSETAGLDKPVLRIFGEWRQGLKSRYQPRFIGDVHMYLIKGCINACGWGSIRGNMGSLLLELKMDWDRLILIKLY